MSAAGLLENIKDYLFSEDSSECFMALYILEIYLWSSSAYLSNQLNKKSYCNKFVNLILFTHHDNVREQALKVTITAHFVFKVGAENDSIYSFFNHHYIFRVLWDMFYMR